MRTLIIAGVMILASTSATVVSAYNSAVDALIDQARQHLVQGDFERADLVAQRIVRIDPEDARGWGLMAEILEAQGNHDEAQQYRSRQRIASRQLDDGERDYINRNGTGDTVAAGGDGLASARPDRYTALEQQNTSPGETRVPDVAPQRQPTVKLAEKKPTPPVDGWDQAKQMRPQPQVEVDSDSERLSQRPPTVSTDSASGPDRITQKSKQDRLREVFASSGAYAKREKSSQQPIPARQSRPQYQYTDRELSQLERMRRQHRTQVARLHRKLFRHDDRRPRHAPRPVDDRVVNSTQYQRGASSSRVGSNDHNRSTASLVPAGYYPPPGSCRIWYYDLAPEQQPPVGSCQRLRSQLPVGARLLKGA